MINSNYVINEIDLSNLFDLNKHPVSFMDDHTEHIPEYGSMIYTVWDLDDKFIYYSIFDLLLLMQNSFLYYQN